MGANMSGKIKISTAVICCCLAFLLGLSVKFLAAARVEATW
jgi:hypothetical protein